MANVTACTRIPVIVEVNVQVVYEGHNCVYVEDDTPHILLIHHVLIPPLPLRNPSHKDRSSASEISGEFCKSERILLSWTKEDIVSPSAQVLGGPISDGEGLYKDLQYMYCDPYYY